MDEITGGQWWRCGEIIPWRAELEECPGVQTSAKKEK